MKPIRRTVLLSGLAAIGATPAFADDSAAFRDDFDRLDRSRWIVADGWTNGDHQSCEWRAEAVAVADGVLRLSLIEAAAGTLACGEIQSERRYGHGTYEARMKVPYAAGMNANLFTFIGAPQDLPHNELDFEFIARDRPVLQTNWHRAGDSDNEELHPMPDDDAFRTYSMTWEPGRIRWYIDGALIREATGDRLPDIAQKVFLSLWSTDTLTDWMGRFDPADAPQALEVDWVAFTPDEEGCRFEGSVLCETGQ